MKYRDFMLMLKWKKKLSDKAGVEVEYAKEPICLRCVQREDCPLAPTQSCSLFIEAPP